MADVIKTPTIKHENPNAHGFEINKDAIAESSAETPAAMIALLNAKK
jgi:hypothetical protein